MKSTFAVLYFLLGLSTISISHAVENTSKRLEVSLKKEALQSKIGQKDFNFSELTLFDKASGEIVNTSAGPAFLQALLRDFHKTADTTNLSETLRELEGINGNDFELPDTETRKHYVLVQYFTSELPMAADASKMIASLETSGELNDITWVKVDLSLKRAGIVLNTGQSVGTFPIAATGVRRIDAVKKVEAMRADIRENMANLPQLFVFDVRSGLLAETEELPDSLKGFVKSHPIPSVKSSTSSPGTLKSRLQNILGKDELPVTETAYKGSRYVVLQYWAAWCSPCLEEANKLNKILYSKKMKNVTWISVEANYMDTSVNVE